MARYTNSHSRYVAWAKTILPMLGIGLLLTLFLFSKQPSSELSIPYARVELEAFAADRKLEEGRFSAVTADGGQLAVQAEQSIPLDGDNRNVQSNVVTGQLDLPDGSTVNLQSDTGTMDGIKSVAEFEGDVVLTTSTGYTVNSEFMKSSLDASKIVSPGFTTGDGPLGDLEAGSMKITQSEDDDSYVMVFQNGVKVIYLPQ